MYNLFKLIKIKIIKISFCQKSYKIWSIASDYIQMKYLYNSKTIILYYFYVICYRKGMHCAATG